MNWEALGAIGEVAGALLVGVTLIYLAVQIRSNTRVTKANASFQATHSWAEVNQRLAELPADLFAPFPSIFEAEVTGDGMSPEQYHRLRYVFRALFQKLEGQYYLYKYGLPEPDVWEVRKAIGRGIVEANPLLHEWWESDTNPANYSQEFISAINSAEPIDAAKLSRPPGSTQ